MALGCSPMSTPMPRRIRRLTFQSAVTSEICESFRAFESARVESVWQTPKSRHQTKKPGLSSGQPLATQAMKANGRRNVKRPQTLMYSSSEWPRRFIVVLRRTWNRAAASDRRTHMVRDPIPRPRPGSEFERDLDGVGVRVRRERLADAVEAEPVGDQRPGPDRAAVDKPERLGELVLIDHRARQGDLAAYDREKRHRRGLVRQPGEHDAAAGPNQLERVRDRLGRAGGLDDQIHAFAPGKPPGGVSGLALGGRVRGRGAELARKREAPSRAAHDHHPRPAGAKDLEGQEPECAGADDRRGLASLRRPARDGADDDGKRLGEQERVGSGARRRAPTTLRGYADELGEAAVDVDADRGPRQAEVAIAFAAQRASSARIVRLDDHRITRGDPRHVRRDRLDAADELVAHHARICDGSRARPDLVVRAAQTRRGDADDRLARLRAWLAHAFDAKIAWPVKHRRFHRAQPTRRLTLGQPT